MTDESSEMRFRERVFESDSVVSLDETDSEGRRQEVLDVAVLLLHHVLAVDNLCNVFGDRCVRT